MHYGGGVGTFTDRLIKSLPVTGKNYRRYEKGSDPGFCVQVTAAGTKIFEQQYTMGGRRRFLRLGKYPDTSLAEARLQARRARQLIDQGTDPQAQAREDRLKGSVKQLAEAYLAHLEARGRRSVNDVRRSLDKNALPLIGELPAKEVRPVHIKDVLYRVIRRGASVEANRLRSYLHAMFQYGVHHDNDPRSMGADVLFDLEINPVASVPRNPDAETPGERNLAWDEIIQVWRDEALYLPFRLAVRLILATGGQRPGEVTRAPWAEFDLTNRVWTIPAGRMKSVRDHLVPLTDLALEILEELRAVNPGSQWLFPQKQNPAAAKPWDKSTLPHVIQDYCRLSGMEPWMPRDLRRTVKTRMGELGVSKLIRDRVQGHAMTDVSARHYDRYDYLPEKREALEAWCRHLEALLAGGNVRAIKERR